MKATRLLIFMLTLISYACSAIAATDIDGFKFSVSTKDTSSRPVEIKIQSGKALSYGLLPTSKVTEMNNLSFSWDKLKLGFVDTSIIDSRNGAVQKFLDPYTSFFMTDTIMPVSNFDSDLGANIQAGQTFNQDYTLYTDLAFSPFSLPTVLSYGNIVSIVLDMKISGKPTLTSNSKFANLYNKLVITPEKKDQYEKILNGLDVTLSIAELSGYLLFEDDTQLDVNQWIGNTRTLVSTTQSLLDVLVPQAPVQTDKLLDTATDVIVDSIKSEFPFVGVLIEAAINFSSSETDNLARRWLLMDLLSRKYYAYMAGLDPQIAAFSTEDEFAYHLKQFMQWKFDSTKFKITKKDMAYLKEIRRLLINSPSLKRELTLAFSKEGFANCLNIAIKPINAVNNVMNSLSNEETYSQLLDYFVREYFLSNFTSMSENLLKNSLQQLTKTLMPGYRVAAAANDLAGVGYDAVTAPKYVPLNVQYAPTSKTLTFTRPKSVDFSLQSFIEDVTDSEISPESAGSRHKVQEILLDIDSQNMECFSGWGCRYNVSRKPALLMKPGPIFYQQFYLGAEGMSQATLSSILNANKTVKVGIDVSSENKGTLLDSINLPKEEMNVIKYVGTHTLNGKQYAAVDFKEMFKDSKNAWYSLFSGENKTYLKLKGGSDVYDLKAVVDFNDMAGHTGGLKGSLFESKQTVFIAQGLGGVRQSIAPIVYYSQLSANNAVLKIQNNTNFTLHYYLYDDTDNLAELLTPTGSSTYDGIKPFESTTLSITSPAEWVANHQISKKIIAFEDKVYRYFAAVYGGNEESIARAVKRMLIEQGSNEYIVAYNGADLTYVEGLMPKQQTLDDLGDNNAIDTMLDGKPYFEVQVADVDAAAFDAQHQVFTTTAGDKVRIYPRNDPNRADFSTLTGSILAVFEDFTNGMVFSSGSRPPLVKPTGTLTNDGGIEVTMPAGKYRLRYIGGTSQITYAQFLVIETVNTIVIGGSLSNGLVAHWSFDDCTATDVSGNGNNGTTIGNPLCIDGTKGKAVNFNGTTDYYQVADNSSLDLTTEFTISLWVNQTDSQYDGYRLIDKTTAGVNDGYLFDTYGNGASGRRMRLVGGSINTYANTDYPLNQWNHLLVSFNNGVAKFYLNGNPDGQGNQGNQAVAINNLPLRIGMYNGVTQNLLFKGSMDDIRIYNRSLSDAEVQQLYNNTTNLVAHWSFDDCTAKDVSGNDNNGVITGSPQCVEGVLDKGYNFNGSFQYIDIANSNVQQITSGEITLSAFIKLNSDIGVKQSRIINKQENNTTTWGLEIFGSGYSSATGNNLTFHDSNGSTWHNCIANELNLLPNKIYHVVSTDNNGLINLYVDGNLIHSCTNGLGIPSTINAQITIGAVSSDHSFGFDGMLDDVRIYNRVLSEQEIKSIYLNGYTELLKKIPVTTYLSENLHDGAYQVGSTTKTWRFKSGANDITGLKAVQVSGKTHAGLGITQSEVVIGDIAANTEFLVNLPINPSHDGDYMKSSYWKLVDANGQEAVITNSKSGRFWLKLRTNHRPRLSPIQLYGMSGMAGSPMSMKILAIDDDADALTYTVNGISATVDNASGVLTANIGVAGVYDFTVTISDGKENIQAAFQAVVANGYQTGRVFADVPDDGLPSRDSYYANIHYLAMLGVVNGVFNTQTGERLFNPGQVASQSEALAMLLRAAENRGFIKLDNHERYLKNLVKEDYLTGEFYNYIWATPYVLKAEQLGIIPIAETFDPTLPATRSWLAQAVVKLLKLEVPLDAIVHPENYQFPDSASFTTTSDYDNARAVAFFHYMGQLGTNFNPASEAVRQDVALISSRIIRTPTMDNATYAGLTNMVINRKTLPSLIHGNSFTITGMNNLKSRQILKSGEAIQENWIGSDGDYVTASVYKTGLGLVESKLAKLYTSAPAVVTTALPDITASEERSLIIVLEDSDSGVISTWRLPYGVVYPDADGDGVRDNLDLWSSNPLYSVDTNNNGIPDNADLLWGISSRMASDTVSINGTSITLINAILNGNLINDRIPPVSTATVTGSVSPFIVNLSVNETGTIYYTTNGTQPTTASAIYTEPLNLASGAKVIYFAVDMAGNAEAAKTVTVQGSGDTTPPIISAFAIPNYSSSLLVTVSFAATDNIGITGWCLSQAGTPSSCAWTSTAPTNYTFQSQGSALIFGYVKDAAGNLASASANVEIIFADQTLNATLSGTGAGTLTSVPAGISCISGTCSDEFPYGASVSLTPTPSAISTFSGWSGSCTNTTGNCNLVMDIVRNVTATFTKAPKAKIDTTGYESLSLAYNGAAVSGSIIKVLDTELIENLYMNSDKAISLVGGYKADYSGKSGLPTILKGILTIGNGSLVVEGLVVK